MGESAVRAGPPDSPGHSPRVGSLLSTVLRMTLLLLSALDIVALGGRLVESIANRAATEPLRAGLVGLLAEVLFLPLLVITIVVLAVSIVGIPLLLLVPFGIVLVVVLMLIGFAGIAFGGWPASSAATSELRLVPTRRRPWES